MKKYSSSFITFFVIFTFAFFIITGDLPLKASDEDRGMELLKAGEDLYDNFKYEESIEKLNQAKLLIKSKKNLSRLYFNLSRSYYALGQTVKTKEILKKLINSAIDDTFFKGDLPKGFIDIYNSLKVPTRKNVLEKPGTKKKKKSKVLIIAGVIVVAALAALLLFKKKESEIIEDPPDPNYYKPMGIEFQSFLGGEFKMGDNFNEGESDESPVHTVMIYTSTISKTEITFDQYDKFCDDTGRAKPSDNGWGRGDLPVINVTWNDANAFCEWLAKKTGISSIRLPSEALWEKAARFYRQSRYPWGNSMNDDYLNYNNNVGKTTSVGTYPGTYPSDRDFGYGSEENRIYDMAGNVSEWCSDWYSSTYYSVSESIHPKGPSSGTEKVIRGGAWNDPAYGVRSARRYSASPTYKSNNLGFRICMDSHTATLKIRF